MAKYFNTTASGQVKTGVGTLYGVIVNSHTSGTLRFNDGTSTTTSAGVKATQVLTASGVFTDGETVTAGDVTYTMVAALSSPAVRNEVLIGANTAAALDNLKSAINGSAGAGTTYSTGTVANPQVTATTNTDTAQTVEAYTVGTAGNAIVTTETCANASWGAATLASGAEPSLLMINTITLAAGPQVLNFGVGVDFYAGLYFTEGGTADVTVIYE
jgi:hypothetical protein